MFRISKMADYAIVVLADLASTSHDGTETTVAVAARTSIPEPTVAKVVKPMAKSGWLTAQRGARGGYRLTQPLHALPVADVISLFDGPITLTGRTSTGTDGCKISQACRVRGRWTKVSSALHTALQNLTVADLLDDKRS